MRAISHIVIHCTATPQTATTASIKKYWKEVNRWKSPGYHYLVEPDGTVVQLAQLWEITNGVGGHNSSIINVAYIGGVASTGSATGASTLRHSDSIAGRSDSIAGSDTIAVDNRTAAQKQSLLYLVRELKKQFPGAVVQGHRDFAGVAKDCPSFDAKKEYANL